MITNFYNYMLIVQQEALKAIIKKQLNIGYQIGADGDVYLADSRGQSAFCISKNNFVLDTARLKEHTSYCEMFIASRLGGKHIEVTGEIQQVTKNGQIRRLHDAENDRDMWINNQFLGYFKNVKSIMYNYFQFRNGTLICAYDSSNFDILGITCCQRPPQR